jgi:hypothetical protein
VDGSDSSRAVCTCVGRGIAFILTPALPCLLSRAAAQAGTTAARACALHRQLLRLPEAPRRPFPVFSLLQHALLSGRFLHRIWFRRKVRRKTNQIFTSCDLPSRGRALCCRGLEQLSCRHQLPCANRMPDFNAGKRTARRPIGLEAERGTSAPLHRPRAFFHDVIQRGGVPESNGRLRGPVTALDRRGLSTTLVEGDFLGEFLSTKSFASESLGSLSISLWRSTLEKDVHEHSLIADLMRKIAAIAREDGAEKVRERTTGRALPFLCCPLLWALCSCCARHRC